MALPGVIWLCLNLSEKPGLIQAAIASKYGISDLKIAFLITHSNAIGGAHMHVKDLASALMALGHKVMVFVGQNGPFTEVLIATRVPHRSLRHLKHPVHPLNDYRAVLEIRDELLAFSPDLVTCHSSKAGWLGRIAAKIAGIPAIFTVHGWAFTDGVPRAKRTVYKWAELLAAPLAQRIITVSEYDRQLAIQSRVAKPDQIVTVLNGIPDIPAQNATKQPSHPVKLVMVARLVEQKNHNGLLQALAGLTHLDWVMDFVGVGPLASELKCRAEVLGIGERVNFPGFKNNISKLLAGSEVLLLNSNWEGLPLCILEAMRAGIPVVATNTGGVCEALQDSETGFLVPRDDVSALENRLALLLTNKERRIRMGQAGRKRYENHFTLNRMVDDTLAVYHDVLRECS